MNTTTTRFYPKAIDWLQAISLTLALWLGATLLLDLVVMPCLYSAGMLSDPGFASAGQNIFGIFNRMEVLCGAVVLSGFLGVEGVSHRPIMYPRLAMLVALLLVAIPLAYLYLLSPTMMALEMPLDQFAAAEIPPAMNLMHASYWMLEVLKIAGIGFLLAISNRTNSPATDA
ncbi:MAG: DUF4149 domain-containing protein [Prochlorothrix sp.]